MIRDGLELVAGVLVLLVLFGAVLVAGIVVGALAGIDVSSVPR